MEITKKKYQEIMNKMKNKQLIKRSEKEEIKN